MGTGRKGVVGIGIGTSDRYLERGGDLQGFGSLTRKEPRHPIFSKRQKCTHTAGKQTKGEEKYSIQRTLGAGFVAQGYVA